jgi:hypothetical protein
MTTPLSTAKKASGAQYKNNNQYRPQFYKYCVSGILFLIMLRHNVSEELKWTQNKINGIVIYDMNDRGWDFATLDRNSDTMTVCFVHRFLKAFTTVYTKEVNRPKFVPFPRYMTLYELLNSKTESITDFIKEHTGEVIYSFR